MNRDDWKNAGLGVVEWFKAHPTTSAIIGAAVVGVIVGAIIF